MDFLTGLTNLTNWFANVIMPTLAGLFFVVAVLRFSRQGHFQYSMYAGFAALMVSGILRAIETFSGMDLILIDTAGRSPRDELKIQELKQLLEAGVRSLKIEGRIKNYRYQIFYSN